MGHGDIPILVVDDAKFSNSAIARMLRASGFSNLRFTDDAAQALRSLEKRPAQILIADWTLPAMDGLELSRQVKAQDESTQHFTHIILLGPRDDLDALDLALASGADDVMDKSRAEEQLLLRVHAAARSSARQNQLLRANALLRRKLREVQAVDLVNPITGLGNLKFALDRIAAASRQAETRGGAACLMLVGICNLPSIQERYDEAAVNELISEFGVKLRNLLRPLDLVAHPEPSTFAVITLQESLEHCTSHSFRRIFNGLYMHSIQTSDGYIPVVVGVSISAADASTGFPDPEQFMAHAQEGLLHSFDTGRVAVQIFDVARSSPTATS